MNSFHLLLLLLISSVFSYPHDETLNENDRLNMYLNGRLEEIDDGSNENSNEQKLVRRQKIFSLLPIQHYQQHQQPACLPHIWTCGPGLPSCCPGLMCFEGNAKRGRYCAARG